jgi:heme/copper-type cytochrome/quinol oxidase subunit 1
VLTSVLALNSTSVIDLHLHDAYFVIAHAHIFGLLALLTMLMWTLYLLTNKILYSKSLMWTHIIITILTIATFTSIVIWGDKVLNPKPSRYIDYASWDSLKMYSVLNNTIVTAILVLIFGQLLFVINFIGGLFKRGT